MSPEFTVHATPRKYKVIHHCYANPSLSNPLKHATYMTVSYFYTTINMVV